MNKINTENLLDVGDYNSEDIVSMAIPELIKLYDSWSERGVSDNKQNTFKIRYYDIKYVLFNLFRNVDEYKGDMLKLFTSIMDSLDKDIVNDTFTDIPELETEPKKTGRIKLVDTDRDTSLLDIVEIMDMKNNVQPTKYLMPNNNLNNKLITNRVVYGEEMELPVNTKNDVINIVKITIDDNVTLSDKSKRFTSYDRVVLEAISSIYEVNKVDKGYVSITVDQVYRCMNGFTSGEKVSDIAQRDIVSSIEKLRSIRATVDITDELKAYGKNLADYGAKKPGDRVTLNDNLLSALSVRVQSGGHFVQGYRINASPILYDYSRIFKQVVSVPVKLLNTSSYLNSTPETTVLRNYLIRRIEVMKGKTNTVDKIAFESVYKELGLENITKQKAEKIRKNITLILEKYINDKYIKDFTFYKKGRSYLGVNIVRF